MSKNKSSSGSTVKSIDVQIPDEVNSIIKIIENEIYSYIEDIKYNPKGKLIEIVLKSKDNILDVAYKLNDLGFDHVKSVTGIDYPNRSIIELLIHVGSHLPVLRKYVVTIRCDLDRENPTVESLIKVWPSSEFQEREAWEMFGIVFKGHPDLRRILLPEEFEGMWPGRKDFKIPLRRPGVVEGDWK